jgi:hypothetical protein
MAAVIEQLSAWYPVIVAIIPSQLTEWPVNSARLDLQAVPATASLVDVFRLVSGKPVVIFWECTTNGTVRVEVPADNRDWSDMTAALLLLDAKTVWPLPDSLHSTQRP